jgi:hypothetical protein
MLKDHIRFRERLISYFFYNNNMKAYVVSALLFVLLIAVVAGMPTLASQFASGFVSAPPDLVHVSTVPVQYYGP